MPDLNFEPAFDAAEKLMRGGEEAKEVKRQAAINAAKVFEGFKDKVTVAAIRHSMKEMKIRNKKCNYVLIVNGQKIYRKNTKALTTYIETYLLSKQGNARCYKIVDEVRESKPVFTIIDGKMELNNQLIGDYNDKAWLFKNYCELGLL